MPLIADRDRFASQNPERSFQCDSREWGYLRFGEHGPALLLIPGTMGRADIFWQVIEALREDTRILAVSYPATGGIEDWASDLPELLAAEGFEEVTVLGSSLGGYLAQYLAATQPALCARLVAANTLPDAAPLRGNPPYSLDLQQVPFAALRAGFVDGISKWDKSRPVLAEIVELLTNEFDHRFSEAEVRTRLSALKTAPAIPTGSLPAEAVFTIESDDDPLITPPIRAATRDALRPGRAYCFAWGGHFPYVTRPTEYTALLREILQLPPGERVWPAGAEAKL